MLSKDQDSHLLGSGTTQERPATLLEELVGVVVDSFHDRAPVQVDGTLSKGNVNGAGEWLAIVCRDTL